MTVGYPTTLSKHPKDAEPGYTIGTFPEATQQAFLRSTESNIQSRGRTRIRCGPIAKRFSTPPGYSAHLSITAISMQRCGHASRFRRR
jgi:hypothetical protein